MITTTTQRSDFQLGERGFYSKTITEADVSAFATLVGNFNPLHVDAEFARKSRFGDRIAHNMLAGGLISAVLGNKLPGPGSIHLSQQIEFLAPIFLGDTITAMVEVVAWQPDKCIVTLRTDCYNQDEKHVVAGQAVMMVPRPEENAQNG